MPTEVVDGVYDITLEPEQLGRVRAFLVDDDIPTLYDAGYEGMETALFEGIEAVGIEPERIVITHGDPDHVGGVDAVVERYDAELWIHEDETYDGDTEPDHLFGDGDRIGRFEVVHVPGHTPGTCAFIDESTGVAILGDTVFGSDMRGLPAGYPVSPTAHFSADYVAAEENLERLLEYEFDVGLLYHGSNVMEDAREKLDAYVNFPGKA